MKKYIAPTVEICEAETVTMMALSRQGGSADPDAEVRTKEEEWWPLWGSVVDPAGEDW